MSIQSSIFQFLSIRYSVKLQLPTAVRPTETMPFCFFLFIFYFYNLELKENKKNLKKENIKGPLNQNKTKKPKSLTRLTLRERERLSYNRRPVPELLQHDGGHGG